MSERTVERPGTATWHRDAKLWRLYCVASEPSASAPKWLAVAVCDGSGEVEIVPGESGVLAMTEKIVA